MILIVEKTITDRAVALRDKLYSLGCPCAVCAPSEMHRYVPFRLIITYIDSLDEVRRMPFDHVYALVIGKGFVNSVLNASQVSDDYSAIMTAHAYLMNEMGITPERMTPFGVMLPPALFVSNDFIEIYGNMVELSPIENMIMKYLIGASCESRPIPASAIAKFCSPAAKTATQSSIAVHISHINSKAEKHFGSHLIRSVSGIGYFSAVNTYDINGT